MTSDLPERVAADVALVMTEIVSNAVRHASRSPGDEIIVRVVAGDIVRVEVVDRGELFEAPSPREPWDAGTKGWGLFLVDSLARDWGIEEEANGKKVWVEFDPCDARAT